MHRYIVNLDYDRDGVVLRAGDEAELGDAEAAHVERIAPGTLTVVPTGTEALAAAKAQPASLGADAHPEDPEGKNDQKTAGALLSADAEADGRPVEEYRTPEDYPEAERGRVGIPAPDHVRADQPEVATPTEKAEPASLGADAHNEVSELEEEERHARADSDDAVAGREEEY